MSCRGIATSPSDTFITRCKRSRIAGQRDGASVRRELPVPRQRACPDDRTPPDGHREDAAELDKPEHAAARQLRAAALQHRAGAPDDSYDRGVAVSDVRKLVPDHGF
jgi:hypothetical protein